MAITERGWRWDLRHSLWIIWALTTVLGFVSFLYIGSKAKKKKWVYWGVAYIVIPVMGLVGVMISPDKGSSLASDILVFGSSALGIFCLGHAVFSLPEYLRAIVFLETGTIPSAAPSGKEPTRFPLPTSAPGSPGSGGVRSSTTAAVDSWQGDGRMVETAPVDVNSAPADALAALPGMDASMASEAVGLRSSKGPFSSVDAFCAALGIDADAARRLKPEIACRAADDGPTGPHGRKVDY